MLRPVPGRACAVLIHSFHLMPITETDPNENDHGPCRALFESAALNYSCNFVCALRVSISLRYLYATVRQDLSLPPGRYPMTGSRSILHTAVYGWFTRLVHGRLCDTGIQHVTATCTMHIQSIYEYKCGGTGTRQQTRQGVLQSSGASSPSGAPSSSYLSLHI